MNREQELKNEIKELKSRENHSIKYLDAKFNGNFKPSENQRHKTELLEAELKGIKETEKRQYISDCENCKDLERASKLLKDKNKHLHFMYDCEGCRYELKEAIDEGKQQTANEILKEIENKRQKLIKSKKTFDKGIKQIRKLKNSKKSYSKKRLDTYCKYAVKRRSQIKVLETFLKRISEKYGISLGSLTFLEEAKAPVKKGKKNFGVKT